MIPKNIFTTWIHDHRTPYTATHERLFMRCVSSWQNLMPDYTIKVIDFEEISKHDDPWLQMRLEEGLFIGASQWARLWYLRKYGGIYFDMDVEAVKAFDPLLNDMMFFGIQKDGFINNAVIGSEVNHPFLTEQLAYIRTCDPRDPQFGNETGPRMVTRLMQRDWIGKCVTVYSPEVFYPYHWNEEFRPGAITGQTYAVHHWASTWYHHA